ncbi:MAG: diacylglycerol/lipid kinase family protein, partial [Stackebrandtia sp.]
VRDIAGGVAASGGVMAIVPAGRGNDLAHSWHIPTSVTGLARLLLHGRMRKVDVLDVNGTVVPGNVYIGIDSVATQIINANRWVPARLLYRLAPVRAIMTWRPPRYTLTVDGESWQGKAHTVVVANSGVYGHGLRIVPPAIVDDGLANLMVVGDAPRRAVATFMRHAKTGAHVHRREVELRTAREVVVDADRPVPVCADGDEVGRLPATIRLRSHAISVLVPD